MACQILGIASLLAGWEPGQPVRPSSGPRRRQGKAVLNPKTSELPAMLSLPMPLLTLSAERYRHHHHTLLTMALAAGSMDRDVWGTCKWGMPMESV